MNPRASNIFKISPTSILFFLLRRHASWALAAIGVPVAVFIIIAIALEDVRYAILALMVVFLLAPMLMAILFFYYALAEDIVFNILPHTLEITKDGIGISLYEVVPEEEKKSESAEPEYRKILERLIKYDNLGRYEAGMDNVVFPVTGIEGRSKIKGEVSGYMYVASSAFTTSEEFKEFVLQALKQSKNGK